jgi:hypothetical protein
MACKVVRALFLLFALAMASICEANPCADGFGCVVVKQTPDGFVAFAGARQYLPQLSPGSSHTRYLL